MLLTTSPKPKHPSTPLPHHYPDQGSPGLWETLTDMHTCSACRSPSGMEQLRGNATTCTEGKNCRLLTPNRSEGRWLLSQRDGVRTGRGTASPLWSNRRPRRRPGWPNEGGPGGGDSPTHRTRPPPAQYSVSCFRICTWLLSSSHHSTTCIQGSG